MKRIIIICLPLLLILLTGCGQTVNKKYDEKVSLMELFYIYTDIDTCVQYFVSNGNYNSGNLSPRYNQDGTIKLNEKCVEDHKSESSGDN